MSDFLELLKIADKLLSDEGCAWDKKQTMQSLQPYFIEEAHELIEAIDEEENSKIIDEAGDVLYSVIFLSKIAEKNNDFSINDVISNLIKKLIRRHPHVFGDVEINDAEGVVKQWNEIKAFEKDKNERKENFGNIPITMPSIAKAQKLVHKAKAYKNKWLEGRDKTPISEKDLKEQMLGLIVRAEFSGIDAENTFNREIGNIIKQLDKNTGDDLLA